MGEIFCDKSAIIVLMHKAVYASGFLYHPPTQQILLQRPSDTDTASPWFLFTVIKRQHETLPVAFQRAIAEQLHIKLPLKNIFQVYDYEDESLQARNVIHYAEVKTLGAKTKTEAGNTLQWCTIRQINKLPLSEQTRQDIVIGQRVILANQREKESKAEANQVVIKNQ